jgi:hypothetical protein
MRRHSLIYLVVISCLLGLVGPSSAAAAITSYLRPNSDVQLDRWTVVGAPAAWDALNDTVTEAQTPALVDYIKNPGMQGHLVVNIETLPLKGQKIVSATAWFYTPTNKPVTLGVSDGVSQLAGASFSTSGWHSVAVPLSGNQIQLDNLTFRFKPDSNGEHQVSAAFLKLTVDDSPKVYWGSWIDGDVYGSESDAPWNSTTWGNFQLNTGKPVSIVHFGQPPPWIQKFDPTPFDKTIEKGAIPLVDMANDFEWFPKHVSLKEIIKGNVDAELTQWSKEIAAYGKPFFLRWDWEMNGTWFPWSKEMMEGEGGVGLHREAWRHFHDIAEAQGATNISWVWCPNILHSGEIGNFNLIYPGNDYVDWNCMDGYNRGTNPLNSEGWRSFSSLFSATYQALLTRGPNKPIMIGEFASTEAGGSKAAWIADALKTQIPNNFPKIKAVVWFNWNTEEEESGTQWDWPIESTPSATSSFAEGISWPYYAANNFGNLPPLTKIQPLP